MPAVIICTLCGPLMSLGAEYFVRNLFKTAGIIQGDCTGALRLTVGATHEERSFYFRFFIFQMGETSQPGGVCGAADKIKNVINFGTIQVRKQGRD